MKKLNRQEKPADEKTDGYRKTKERNRDTYRHRQGDTETEKHTSTDRKRKTDREKHVYTDRQTDKRT